MIITPHWESPEIAVSFTQNYDLLYDYHGFPENTYNINYAVKGDVALAEKVESLLMKRGIQTRRDETRGLDHGSFVPLMEIIPKGDIPVVQISVRDDHDASFHYEL